MVVPRDRPMVSFIIGQLQDEGAVGIGEELVQGAPGSKARPMPLPRDIFKIPLPPRRSRGYRRPGPCPSSPGGSPSGRPFSGRPPPAGRPAVLRAEPHHRMAGPLNSGERMRLTLSVVTAKDTRVGGGVQILKGAAHGVLAADGGDLQLLLGPVGPQEGSPKAGPSGGGSFPASGSTPGSSGRSPSNRRRWPPVWTPTR